MSAKQRFLEAAREQLRVWEQQLEQAERDPDPFASRSERPVRLELRDLVRQKRSLDRRLEFAMAEAPACWSEVRRDLAVAMHDFDHALSRVLGEVSA